MSDLRRGYTTGACAQAATAAAAVWAARTEAAASAAAVGIVTTVPREGLIEIDLPGGEQAVFPYRIDEGGTAWVVKDAGDDPDVTHGLAIGAHVDDTSGFFAVRGGVGVGTVTLPGLPIAPGGPAINPVPREAILGELRRLRPGGATVTISLRGARSWRRRHSTRGWASWGESASWARPGAWNPGRWKRCATLWCRSWTWRRRRAAPTWSSCWGRRAAASRGGGSGRARRGRDGQRSRLDAGAGGRAGHSPRDPARSRGQAGQAGRGHLRHPFPRGRRPSCDARRLCGRRRGACRGDPRHPGHDHRRPGRRPSAGTRPGRRAPRGGRRGRPGLSGALRSAGGRGAARPGRRRAGGVFVEPRAAVGGGHRPRRRVRHPPSVWI